MIGLWALSETLRLCIHAQQSYPPCLLGGHRSKAVFAVPYAAGQRLQANHSEAS